MEGDENNLEKLKYATEWQIEIGKVLQSFDPVLRPLEDMAKHGITMATVLLGISASIVGGFASGNVGISCNYILILGAWFALVVAAVAGSIQLYRISRFRETIRNSCHVLLGKEASLADRQSAMNVMDTPQKNVLTENSGQIYFPPPPRYGKIRDRFIFLRTHGKLLPYRQATNRQPLN